jgi:CubicO group peptidase (beta-lactamase class C family)
VRLDGELALTATARELERGLAEHLHRGGQIYVWRAGAVVADAAFGESRPGVPMTRRHSMLWLSSTKPLAAMAIARLWEAGRLGLDDPVARHIPEFAAGGKGAVTVRHLLTHTAGIRMLDTGWPMADWDAILARICARRIEPGWIPGAKAGYHLASSWFVLGELVRRLDGRPFERWVREEIFEPLGARSCWVGIPAERLAAERELIAPMYESIEVGSGRRRLTELPWLGDRHLTVSSPGASGVGPLRELARFYEMLLAGGEWRGRRLLSAQTVEAMTARHRVGLLDQTFKTRLDWGLGVIVNSAHYGETRLPYGYGPHAGARTFGHSGARSSTAFADPDARLVVALAVNGLPDDETHRLRFERLTAAIYEDLGLAPPAPAPADATA